MTQEQELKISELRAQYEENCRENEIFGSAKICSFKILKPKDVSDLSVTVLWNKITGLSDEMIPESSLVAFNITHDGLMVNMGDLLSFFELNKYLEGLTEQ